MEDIKKEALWIGIIKKSLFFIIIILIALGLFKKGLLIPVVLGLLALNIIVLIHEGGHFLVAKLCKVEVQTFSIGMGPKLFSIMKNGVEFCISLLPIGGYVRMAGESLFDEALQKNDATLLEAPGSLFGATPPRKIAIAAAGAFFNLISAVIFFFFAYLIGFSQPTNSVVAPITIFDENSSSAAQKAGLLPEDQIVKIGKEKINLYDDIARIISTTNEDTIIVTVKRNKKLIEIPITLEEEGSRKVAGIVWITKPIVSAVKKGSPYEIAGLKANDVITAINSKKIEQFSYYHFYNEIQKPFLLEWKRGEMSFSHKFEENDIEELYGLSTVLYRSKEGQEGVKKALVAAVTKPALWIYENFKGLYTIAKDPNRKLKDNATGPIGITAGIGMATIDGFRMNFFDGIGNFLMLSAVISSIIAVMNLLPIPALDGGMILFTLIEWIRGKRFSPKTFFNYQLIGFIVIMLLGILIITMDLSNFIKLF